MTYEYTCETCSMVFDVIKSHKDMDVVEYCPKCDEPAIRNFVPSKLYLNKTAVEHSEYNPGLGCVTKNSKDRAEIAKRKGLVEIGNDYKTPDSLHKEMDTGRLEKLKKRYEDI